MTVVWGIDTSTRAVSLAIADDDTATTTTHTLHIDSAGRLRGAERAARHLLALTPWIVAHALKQQPECVAVEAPYGHGGSQNGAHPSSQQCYGILLAVLGTHIACPIVELSPTQWKDYGLGNARADKAQILQWAQLSHNYDGALQDEADAIGVACAASYLLWRERRAAA
jgi:Holliday junction resolvasome RuvABC endonuclease subunit